MVQDVEELGSEAKPHPLVDGKYPLHSNISLRSCETSQHVAAEITLLPGRCWCKGRFIENFAAGILRSVELQRHSGLNVRTRIKVDTLTYENCADDFDGRSRPGEDEAIQRRTRRTL